MTKKSHKIYTDLDLSGNKLVNTKVDTPSLITDPTPKDYVDKGDMLDTTLSNRFNNPFNKIGGMDVSFAPDKKTFHEIFDAILYPRIAATYEESSIEVASEPLKAIIGIDSKFTVQATIKLGDRQSVVGNITCIHKDAFNITQVTYANTDSGLTNINAQFYAKAIDAESLTQFTLSCVLGPANIKNDSYGEASPNQLFQSNYTESKIITYQGVLPVFYKLCLLGESAGVNVLAPGITWNQIVTNLNYISDVSKYTKTNDGLNEVGITIPNTSAYDIVLFVPNTCKRLYIGDNDILECVDKLTQVMQLPNTRNTWTQNYTGIVLRTGDVKFSTEKQLRIIY